MRGALLTLSLLFLLIVALCPPKAALAHGAYSKDAMSTDTAKGGQLVKKISSIQVLAPLAPVALSPFFGITCLSGTSILCSKGVLPKNEFLMGNPALNNGLVFVVFLALTIATSLPKMTAVSKGVAQAVDQLETYAGIITYAAVIYLAGSGHDGGTQQVVYQAGLISFTRDTLLMAAAAVNIIVINTVKWFFEFLVWLSPIPGLDAAFEAANKVVTAMLATVYAFSPYLALLLNIVLFLVSLAMFNWTRRRVKYFRVMYGEPVLAKLLHKTDFSPPERVRAKVSAVIDQGRPLLRVFPVHKIGKIKKHELCYLVSGKEGLSLVRFRLLRGPKIGTLGKANTQIEIRTGLLTNTLEIQSPDLQKPATLAFSKVYNAQLEGIADSLRPFGQVRMPPAAQGAGSTQGLPQTAG
jgi:hypothetical protein